MSITSSGWKRRASATPRSPAPSRRWFTRSSRLCVTSGGAADDHELDAAILRPRFVARAFHQRAVLTVTDRLEPRGVDALVDEVRADRLGAPLAELAVLLGAAAVVGVAFDADLEVDVLAQHL